MGDKPQAGPAREWRDEDPDGRLWHGHGEPEGEERRASFERPDWRLAPPQDGHSDLSGERFDGTARAQVRLSFDDGQRRDLAVTVHERDALLASGRDVTRMRARLASPARRLVINGGKVVLAIALTAWLSAEVGRIYADHKDAVAVKSALISSISKDSRRAYAQAFQVAADAQTQRSTQFPKRRNTILSTWAATAATVDTTMFIHFESTPVQDDWQAFDGAVAALVNLAYVEQPAGRRGYAVTLRRYLASHPSGRTPARPDHNEDPWEVLGCSAPNCARRPAWLLHYQWVGRWVMQASQHLGRTVFDTDAKHLS
jgi:hypothetical protein